MRIVVFHKEYTNADHIKVIPPAAFGGFKPEQMKEMLPEVFAAFTEDQFKELWVGGKYVAWMLVMLVLAMRPGRGQRAGCRARRL